MAERIKTKGGREMSTLLEAQKEAEDLLLTEIYYREYEVLFDLQSANGVIYEGGWVDPSLGLFWFLTRNGFYVANEVRKELIASGDYEKVQITNQKLYRKS